MISTRHEEYTYIGQNLPFVLYPHLERTAFSGNREQNWHENLEIEYCTAGEGYVLLDGVLHPFCCGDTVTVNSNEIHYTGTSGYLCYACLILDTVFCRQVGIDPFSLRFVSHRKSQEVGQLFDLLASVYAKKEDKFRTARLYQILLQLLLVISEDAKEVRGATVGSRSLDNVKGAIGYIRENFARKVYLDEIAAHVYADKYQLSRDFKKVTGKTIMAYTDHYRCQRAAEMIETGARVSEAARSVGFENMSFFTKTFQKYMGDLPSHFKAK